MEKTITLKKPFKTEYMNAIINEKYEALNLIVDKIVETEYYVIIYFIENS